MALISNGTTIASGGSLSVSANPPSSVGAVGTYAMMRHNNNSQTYTEGSTLGGSNLYYTSAGGNYMNNTASGTWRVMGVKSIGGAEPQTTIWIRIS